MNSSASILNNKEENFNPSIDKIYYMVLDRYLRMFGLINLKGESFDFSKDACFELRDILNLPVEMIFGDPKI